MSETQLVDRIGIALSGGTLKAAAHIGVLSALEDIGIRPHCVAGTSAGSFVAALYAHDYSSKDFAKLIDTFPGKGLLDYGFPMLSSAANFVRYRIHRNVDRIRVPNGMLNGNKLRKYFTQTLEERRSTTPYYVVATDILTGDPVVFTNDTRAVKLGIAQWIEDDPATIISGSCALPGIFTPVRYGKWLLVDGAFRHYVPVQVLRKVGCTKIIAVNLNRLEKMWRPETVVHVLARAFDIMLQELIQGDVEGKDLFVLEPNLSEVTWVSFGKLGACVEVGRKTVHSNQDKLHIFLRSPTQHQLENAGSDKAKGRRKEHRLVPMSNQSPILKIQGAPIPTKKPPQVGGHG